MTLIGVWKTQNKFNKIAVPNQQVIIECSCETWTREKVLLSLKVLLKQRAAFLVLALVNEISDIFIQRLRIIN
jgi:hypothetical protein